MTEPWIQASDIAHDVSPPMSALSSHELVVENDGAIPGTPARLLLIGIIASVLVHLTIVLIVAKVSRHRGLPVAESPPVSVQIRITHTSRPPPSAADVVVPIVSDPVPEPMPATEAIVALPDNDLASEPETPEPPETAVAQESPRQADSGESVTAAEGAPILTAPTLAPSMLDIRRAVRSVSGSPNESPDPTCSPWMLRHEMFANCEPNANLIDFERASRTAILAPLVSDETTTEAETPSNGTDTTQRIRSLLDRIDDRLGTSRTRRSIMQLP